jgi:predicted RND superfamily exporter protein
MGFFRIPLDPFNTTTPILILAVSAGHAVQILKRYYEEYDRFRDTEKAVRIALLRVGPVMVTAGAIAALSFFSLTVFGTATVRNFGLLTGFGIVSALIIELTLIPAVRLTLPAPRPSEILREARAGSSLEAALRGLESTVSQRPRTIVMVALLISALGLLAATRLHVDTTLKRQFGRTHAIRIADDAINAALAGTNTLIFLITTPRENGLHDPRSLRAIRGLQEFLASDPAVGKTLAITDFLCAMQKALHGGQATADPLPESAELTSQYLLLYSMSGDPEDLSSQIDNHHRTAVLRTFVTRDSTEYGEGLIARSRRYIADTFPRGYTVQYSGIIASNAALTDVMVHGKILNMLQIAAIIILMAAFLLRSLVAGFLIAVPLAMAVIVNFGVMGILGIPLDIVTSPIAAMAVGIGADYAIYFVSRFKEELAVSSTRELALSSTLRSSGKAIVYVSSAIAGGYLVLCVSGFVYHVELALMVGLAMMVSSTAAITVLPALLVITEPRFLVGHPRSVDRHELHRRAG